MGQPEIRFRTTPIAGLEAMTASTTLSFPRHTHEQYGLGVIDAGGHASLSDRRMVRAGRGSLIFVNPGEVHDGRPIGGRSRTWRILYFEPDLMQQLRRDVSERDRSRLAFPYAAFSDPPLRRLFDAAFFAATAAQPGTDRIACEATLLRLVDRLISIADRREQRRAPTPSVRRAVQLIDADPAAQDLSLTRLAHAAGTTRFSLIRAFARELCLTPHAYVLQRRLNLAQRLLRSGASIADVAVRAGFFDQSHLTRCFSRQFGVSPGRYAAVHR